MRFRRDNDQIKNIISDFVMTLESDKERINELNRPEVIEQKKENLTVRKDRRETKRKSLRT